jgi:hypothetical protein
MKYIILLFSLLLTCFNSLLTAQTVYSLAEALNYLSSVSKTLIPAAQPMGPVAQARQKEEEARKADLDRKQADGEKKKEAAKIKPAIGGDTKIAITGFPQINFTLQAVKNMKATKPEEKKAQKDKAREFMRALYNFVESKKALVLTNMQQKQIKDALSEIVIIDPLLISPVVQILKTIQAPHEEIYKHIVDLYEKRIVFLEKEFSKIKPDKKLYKGVRDDIDEAMGYPVEISGELQAAQIEWDLEKNQKAKQFYDEIEALRQRLLKLLQAHKKTIQDTNAKTEKEEDRIPIEDYIEMVNEKPRAYCLTKITKNKAPIAYSDFARMKPQFETCDNIYVPFYEDLTTILSDIEAYKKKEAQYTPSIKNYKKHNIINKLRAFITYATATDFCQYCFNQDIKDYVKNNPNYGDHLRNSFNIIETFFAQLPAAEQTDTIKQAIKLAQEERATLQTKFKALEYNNF